MAKKKKKTYSPAFRAKAVSIYQSGESSMMEVARSLELPPSSLRTWVRQAEVDAGKGPSGALHTAEKEELSRLRREVKQLREERAILKAAATFFAKESR